jgi:tetratricopeptide (TPR) repeat protein
MGFNRKRVLIVVGVLFTVAVMTAGGIAWRYRKGERADSLTASVQAHLAAGRFPEAKIEGEKLVRIASNDANAHLLLAKACLAGRDPGTVKTTEADALRAVRELLAAVRINQGLTEAQRMVLAYYAGQRNYTESMPYAQELLRVTPEDSQANFMISRALVQLNRPLEARKHLERLIADEKAGLRPRTAALAAAVGEGLGKDGKAFVDQADEALAAYMREQTKFETVDDRISLVELRCWKAHRPNTPPNIVRAQLTAAVQELDRLVKDQRSNDMLPGFVLDAVKQILPRERMSRPELQPIVKELQVSIDRVTTDTFTLAVERKILDPRLYTAYGERLRDKGEEDRATAIVKQGLENSKNATDLVKREFGVCELWLAKHFLAQKRSQDAKPYIDSLVSHPDWKPWGQLMLGYSLVIEDKFDQAAPPLQEAVMRLGESNGAAHALYGLCMLRRGFITQGREHLERGKALGADGAQFRAWLTLALAEAGENQAALQMAKEIIAGAGGKSETVGGVSKALEGELRMRTGDLDGAEACLKDAVERTDPKLRSAVKLSQAQLWMARKDWPKAKEILDEVKKDENFAYRAYANESRWLQENGENAKATEALAEGRRRFPNNGLLLALQINDLTREKKYDAARQVLQEERNRQPDKELPFLLLSEVFDAARKPEQAINVLQEASKQFPKEASIKLRLVDKLIERGRTVEVGQIMADLEGDASVNPSSLVYLKARRAIAEGDLERATALVEEGRKRDKHSPLLAQLMARLVANEGKVREAGEILRPTYNSNPGRQNTALMFDTMLADGKYAEASQHLRDAQLRGQSEIVPVLRRKLVRLLAQREQHAELERELAALLASRPSETDVALAVNLYQGIKREDKAQMILKKALAQAPDSFVLNEVNIALMLDRNDEGASRAAHEKIAVLFKKPIFLRDPTLHALQSRAFISKNELPEALKAVEFGLEKDKAPGNPALAALKVQILLRMKRDSEAEKFAFEIKKDFPTLPPAKYLLARAYEALGQTEKAFTLLAELASSDPSDANAAHHYLRLLISRGQFGDLEPSIEKFIAANSAKSNVGAKENPLLLGVLAEYHATRGDVPKAKAVLHRLERTQEAGVVVPYLRGVIAFAEGKLPDAEKSLQLAMTDPAGHIPSTFLLAQIRAQEGRLNDSLNLLGRIAKSPDSPAAVPLLRATLMVRTGKFEEAESACRDYLKLNPSARPFRQLLTQVLMQRGTDAAKQEALSIAESSLEQGVDNPLDFEVFLKVMMLAGRTDKALQVITDQALTKNRPELLLAGGRACYSAGQYRESERYAKKLVTDEPHNLNAKLLLGDSLMRIGDVPDAAKSDVERADAFEKAAAQYRDVLKAQPENMIAANNLAWVIGIHLGRPHRAIEELQTTFKGTLSETNKALPAEVLDTIGFLHLKMDHYTDAQRYLEEAAIRKPTSAEIQVHLGETYLKQDRADRARQCFEKAKELDPKGEFTSQIQRLLSKR